MVRDCSLQGFQNTTNHLDPMDIHWLVANLLCQRLVMVGGVVFQPWHYCQWIKLALSFSFISWITTWVAIIKGPYKTKMMVVGCCELSHCWLMSMQIACMVSLSISSCSDVYLGVKKSLFSLSRFYQNDTANWTCRVVVYLKNRKLLFYDIFLAITQYKYQFDLW